VRVILTTVGVILLVLGLVIALVAWDAVQSCNAFNSGGCHAGPRPHCDVVQYCGDQLVIVGGVIAFAGFVIAPIGALTTAPRPLPLP
jgi:uncharacterized membrane protein